MRKTVVMTALAVLLAMTGLLVTGCGLFDHPGKTAAEVHREHLRTVRVNRQQMLEDIDRTLGVDQPSKLTDKTLP